MSGTSDMPLSLLQKVHKWMQNGIKKRPPKIKRPWVVFLGCIILIAVIIHITFIRYRTKAEGVFYAKAIESLDSLTVEQLQGLQDYLDDVDENLRMMQILMVISAVFGVGVYGLYRVQRKQVFFERERYHLLNEFSDTILIYYYYKTDTMTLTSNVQERFHVNTLQKEGYLKGDQSCLGINEENRVAIREFLSHPEPGSEMKTIRFSAKDKSGDDNLWCFLQLRFVFEKGEAVAAIGKITDISSQKKLEEKLRKQAQMDGLTGTYNKEAAKHKITKLVERQHSGYLIMMDVDNFKQINDIHGHTMGDEVLIHIGTMLHHVFQSDDVIGRIGGDEFVVFVSGNKSGMFRIERYAQSILDHMLQFQDEGNVEVTISIGIAFCPEDGETYEALYQAADRAMYLAKRKGKNRYCFADDSSGTCAEANIKD